MRSTSESSGIPFGEKETMTGTVLFPCNMESAANSAFHVNEADVFAESRRPRTGTEPASELAKYSVSYCNEPIRRLPKSTLLNDRLGKVAKLRRRMNAGSLHGALATRYADL